MRTNIELNGRTVQAEPGEMLLGVLRREGVHVPTLCRVEGLSPTGACRLCVVEVAGERGLVPSCAAPVREGMKVETHSERAVQARRTIVELLLSSHPDDCLYCPRNGACELQDLAAELGVRQRRFGNLATRPHLDLSSPAVERDPAKCILCGRCVRVCEEVQGVAALDFIGRGSQTQVGTAFGQGLNVSSCIGCGQCIAVCPTGALRERSHLRRVEEALADPQRVVVVQHAPAVSVSLGEELDLPMGRDVAGLMTAALRRLGFEHVFDTSFSADLTVMEEASELIARVREGGPLPLLTSCSPGWISRMETRHPDLLPHLSTCKSPQQMLGALIKTVFAKRIGRPAEQIFSVSVMPCTAKKFEAQRPEMGRDGHADIDAVLTTRELAQLIRARGIRMEELVPGEADTPFGERSSAGKLFGGSGGVMQAALRTAHWLLTGENAPTMEVEGVWGGAPRRIREVSVGDLTIRVAVVSGVGHVDALLDEIRAGRSNLHFVEVMTCPGGCVNGGGQPWARGRDVVRGRSQALQRIDRNAELRLAHENPMVKRLYDEELGAPNSARSHALLHTRYAPREVVL